MFTRASNVDLGNILSLMQKSTQGTNDSPLVYSRAFLGVTTEDLHQFYGLN
jgi:hypothetical protein